MPPRCGGPIRDEATAGPMAGQVRADRNRNHALVGVAAVVVIADHAEVREATGRRVVISRAVDNKSPMDIKKQQVMSLLFFVG